MHTRNRHVAYCVGIITIFTLILSNQVFASHTTTTETLTEPFRWEGGYVGGFAGGTTPSRVTSTEPLRLDNNAFWFRPFNDSFRFKTRASFIGGINLGYNWQPCLSSWMLGLEGEYSYLNLHRSKVDPNQFPYASLPNNNLQNSSVNSIKIGKSGYGFIGARLGYAIDCLLFYVKSGAIFTKIHSQYNSVKTEDRSLAFLHLSGSKKITTYALGAGIEYALPFEALSNFSTKIEYMFIGFNKKQYVYGHCSCDFLWRNIESFKGISTVKLGIHYNFGH